LVITSKGVDTARQKKTQGVLLHVVAAAAVVVVAVAVIASAAAANDSLFVKFTA